MIKNYIKIAWRNLLRHKLFSLINISGLAVGLAVCMLIMFYVAHEYSYDRFHKNANRIFTLTERFKLGAQDLQMEYTSYATASLIQQAEPLVAGTMRTYTPHNDVIVENPLNKQTRFSEGNMLFADENFFSFFSFKLLSGNAKSVFSKTFSIIISQSMAKKYFGNQNPVGKMLKITTDKAYLYEVTGVSENVPSNSSISFDFMAPNSSLKMMTESKQLFDSQYIQGGSFKTYLLLNHAEDKIKLDKSLQSLIKKNSNESNDKLLLTALPETHIKQGFDDSSNTKYLKIFPFVAGLILLLALVNYMSLSTARSTLRAKEVGVRKVTGASRKSLAMQFYVESALYACLSFTLGYILCVFFKSAFLNILQLKIDDSFFYSDTVLMSLTGLLLLTILIAGSYPSIILSAFKPVVTLKGKMSKHTGGITVRKIFTTLQFTISVALIICGIIIDRQLYYFRHTDTGVNRENVVMIPVSDKFGKQYQSFRKDVQALAGISQVATSHYPMYKGYDIFYLPGTGKGDGLAMPVLSVDQNFIPTLNIKWKIPPLSKDVLTRSKKIVLNEVAITKLKLPAKPIGRIIEFGGSSKYEIAGVVKNFNYTSLASTVGPLCMFVSSDTTNWGLVGGCLFAKIKTHTNLPSLLSSIQSIYKKYDQDIPFNYTFMDDAFNQQYKAEERLASIFSIFTVLTILLAGMGLFGLAAFTIEQRTKEIGVRKILGASLSSIASLLSVDFLKLVLLSALIASPIAWWAMHGWLQNFAYRIHIQWWMFGAAGLLAVVVALITVSYHAIKAAIANPVNSLRSE